MSYQQDYHLFLMNNLQSTTRTCTDKATQMLTFADHRVKKLEHNVVDWHRSQIKDRNQIKELKQMLRKLATEADCYLEEMLETGSADTSTFADTIIEAERISQKEKSK